MKFSSNNFQNNYNKKNKLIQWITYEHGGVKRASSYTTVWWRKNMMRSIWAEEIKWTVLGEQWDRWGEWEAGWVNDAVWVLWPRLRCWPTRDLFKLRAPAHRPASAQWHCNILPQIGLHRAPAFWWRFSATFNYVQSACATIAPIPSLCYNSSMYTNQI